MINVGRISGIMSDMLIINEMQIININIESIRVYLYHLLNIKSDLLHPDVILASEELDKALNRYYALQKKI